MSIFVYIYIYIYVYKSAYRNIKFFVPNSFLLKVCISYVDFLKALDAFFRFFLLEFFFSTMVVSIIA